MGTPRAQHIMWSHGSYQVFFGPLTKEEFLAVIATLHDNHLAIDAPPPYTAVYVVNGTGRLLELQKLFRPAVPHTGRASFWQDGDQNGAGITVEGAPDPTALEELASKIRELGLGEASVTDTHRNEIMVAGLPFMNHGEKVAWRRGLAAAGIAVSP